MAIYKKSLFLEDTRQQPQIRLLCVPPAAKGQPIHCELEYETLTLDMKHRVKYDALSYCWGDAVDTRPIYIDGLPFDVRLNLYSALHHLRDDEGVRPLWVDAICINQNDILEKNQQVARMQQIYASAQHVFIWLGEASSASKTGFDLIYDVLRARSLDKILGIETRNLWDLDQEHWGLPLTTNSAWYDMFSVIQRPWFKRAWVIQELAACSNAILFYGDNTIL